RAGADGADRLGDRRDRDPHVHADLRAGREPAMITSEEISQARSAAAASRRRLVEVLEEQLAHEPDTVTARLAGALRLERMTMAELRAATPIFEELPFAECSQRGCVLLRSPDG